MSQKLGIFRLKIGQELSLEHFKRHGVGMAADGLKQPFLFQQRSVRQKQD